MLARPVGFSHKQTRHAAIGLAAIKILELISARYSHGELMHFLNLCVSGMMALVIVDGLGATAAAAAAQDSATTVEILKRRTILLSTAGKTSEITLPIGTPARLQWSARKTSYSPDGSVHLQGHVQLTLSLDKVQPLNIYADEAVVRSEELDAGQMKAVRDLEQMGVSDQSLRGNPNVMSPADVVKQGEIDKANMQRLASIIKSYGWPGNRFAGIDNASNAFLVLQHADLASQHQYLPLLRRAVAKGEANAQDLAMLEDRVLVRAGKPQLYGTQFLPHVPNQPITLFPVQDEVYLDKRRSELGMPPMADYIKSMQKHYEKN
jgi:hypothetical protein